MDIGLHVKHPSFSSDVNTTCIFSTYFFKITQISYAMKIRSVVPCGREGGRSDRHEEANRLFTIFFNTLNNTIFKTSHNNISL